MPVHGGPRESRDPTGPPVPSPVTPAESGQVRQTATRFAQLQTTCGFACTEVTRPPCPEPNRQQRPDPDPVLP